MSTDWQPPQGEALPHGLGRHPAWRQGFGVEEFTRALSGVLDHREVRTAAATHAPPYDTGPGAFSAIGRLLTDPDRAYELLEERLLPAGFTPQLREQGDEHIVFAVADPRPAGDPSPRRAFWFFIATLLSVLLTGGAYDAPQAMDRLLAGPSGSGGWLGMVASLGEMLVAGIPYAASLLGILVAHEAGHFIAARKLGIPSGYPYLIPLPPPLSLFGTLGAVMRIMAPPRDRRALLAMAAAGPLAGLVVAIPVLLIGLASSPVGQSQYPALQEGNSLLYWLLKLLVKGESLPIPGRDVQLNSVAFAGWTGLFVTAINLLPIGQLDGGHIAYAVLGPRARYLGWAITGLMAALVLVNQNWVVLVLLLLFFGRVYAVPFNDASRLRPAGVALGVAMMILFALLFVPDPLKLLTGP